MSIDAKRRYAGAGFVVLLLLSTFWPSPIVSSNRLWLERSIGVDELSFLGREAPSWDVVFWCIAGIFALFVVQSGEFSKRDLRALVAAGTTAFRPAVRRRYGALIALAAGALVVAAVWMFADERVIAAAETLRVDRVESVIRILNRFGGGMNPPMIVIFFVVAGIAYRHPLWVRIGVSMAVAGLIAGLSAHALKALVGRTRPELWMGAFHFARGDDSSFPSGHTVGAFALAGVLLFLARSVPLKVVAIALASAVGISRVIAMRHWPSDVVASAVIGLVVAWAVSSDYASRSANWTDTSREQPASSIVTP